MYLVTVMDQRSSLLLFVIWDHVGDQGDMISDLNQIFYNTPSWYFAASSLYSVIMSVVIPQQGWCIIIPICMTMQLLMALG